MHSRTLPLHNFVKFGVSKIVLCITYRWELSEEEESGGSDVETLVNQQSAVSLNVL